MEFGFAWANTTTGLIELQGPLGSTVHNISPETVAFRIRQLEELEACLESAITAMRWAEKSGIGGSVRLLDGLKDTYDLALDQLMFYNKLADVTTSAIGTPLSPGYLNTKEEK